MNYKRTTGEIIAQFNDSHKIQDVIETITGGIIKNKSLCCPLHGGDNKAGASIHIGKNIFTCWTGDCGRAITPWYFIQKYYGLNSFKEVAQKANDLFNANIPVYEKKEVSGEEKQEIEYDAVYNVDKYLNEVRELLKHELKNNNHLLLNANTGLGKTFGIVDLMKDNIFADDYIFFLVPTRAIAEQVAKEYPIFKLFYDKDTKLPKSNFIVSTYHKVDRLNDALTLEIETRAKLGEFPPMYAVVLDECHELMSKRNLLGSKARKIEEFIKNSDRSILMSANTNYFNTAYKDTGIFNKYISVTTKEITYNADLLQVYRLPKKEVQKTQHIINTIIDKLNKGFKVLFYEDSKNSLQEYASALNKQGKDNIIIHSDNKEEEETKENYKGIIDNGHLVKSVTFTTSLINAGVNIKDNNIALIVKQDKNKADLQKVEQFLARVRTTGNDLTLFLSSPDEEVKPVIADYKPYKDRALTEAKYVIDSFNLDLFSAYGLDITEEKLRNLWAKYKNNEAYADKKKLVYIDDTVLKVDNIAVFEKARLEFERGNYYKNNFIKKQLKNVKVKDIIFNDLKEIEVEEEDKKEKIKSTSEDAIKEVMSKSELATELYKVATGEQRGTESENEEYKEFHEKYNQNKLYKEMMKNLKDSLIPNLEDDRVSKVALFTGITSNYTEKTKKKERDQAIANIKRVEILNKTLPVGTKEEKIRITGDYVYIAVRKNFDYCITSRKAIINRCYYEAVKDLINFRNLKSYTGDDVKEEERERYRTDTKGKKVSVDDLLEEVKDCINSIYEVTNKNYITKLK